MNQMHSHTILAQVHSTAQLHPRTLTSSRRPNRDQPRLNHDLIHKTSFSSAPFLATAVRSSPFRTKPLLSITTKNSVTTSPRIRTSLSSHQLKPNRTLDENESVQRREIEKNPKTSSRSAQSRR
ncbi:hypothetical protein KC19_9G051200 [Ceratodon purpureus]|uniref:Uncharacterized protein n=1 Tax=Ceratodon purpureus TaxID=3225 RepID=A0A8T0GSD9_CERPU|nr:hypothetical protein KC19_9G051200 [Ceratodon purpureus]